MNKQNQSYHWIFQVASSLLPLLVSLILFPLLLKNFGSESFGRLIIYSALFVYLGLLDFGQNRSLIQILPKFIALDNHEGYLFLIIESFVKTLFFAILFTSLIFFGTDYLNVILKYLNSNFEFSITHKREVRLLVLGLAPYMFSNLFLSVFEANSHFYTSSIIRLFNNLFFVLIPYFGFLFFGAQLDEILYLFIFLRYLVFFITLSIILRQNTFFKGSSIYKFRFKYSSLNTWNSISNFIGAFMTTGERVIVGLICGSTVVPHYSISFDVAARFQIFPNALLTILFPKRVDLFYRDKNEYDRSQMKIVHTLFLVSFPVYLFLIYFSQELLCLWIGSDFASESFRILQFFSFSSILTILCQLPFINLQSSGNSRIIAIFHSVEFVIYLLLVFLLGENFGIVGIAIASLIRVIIDTVLLIVYSRKFSVITLETKSLLLSLVSFSVICISPVFYAGFYTKVFLYFLLILSYVIYSRKIVKEIYFKIVNKNY